MNLEIPSQHSQHSLRKTGLLLQRTIKKPPYHHHHHCDHDHSHNYHLRRPMHKRNTRRKDTHYLQMMCMSVSRLYIKNKGAHSQTILIKNLAHIKHTKV